MYPGIYIIFFSQAAISHIDIKSSFLVVKISFCSNHVYRVKVWATMDNQSFTLDYIGNIFRNLRNKNVMTGDMYTLASS